MRTLLLSSGCLLVAAALWAQPDEAKLRGAMKQIGPTVGALNKKIVAKDATAAADARKLHDLFGDVHEFWQAKGAADAVNFAASARSNFSTAAEEIAAGKWDEAAATVKKNGANCAGCHTAHREKAEDGSWKIK